MSNRLKYETSPYLLQHANNPVDWYPWCDQAFEKAQKEDKPIFLSIGYSTCHWCHVMARESFENVEIAKTLNKNFVCIKVDREERPDIDSVYMSACKAFTGSGGWPTSLFLTADKKPFFAGTYFPPFSHYGMPGFHELLNKIVVLWKNDRDTLIKSANEITLFLNKKQENNHEIEQNILSKAVYQFKKAYDEKNGGFGCAPKFPTPHNLIFLLLYGTLKNDKEATDMALFTLSQMSKGGIYDHLGGGFSRYSTDDEFLVPHFEKMLYDNALLIIAYSVAFSVTKNQNYLSVAKECAEFVLRELTDSNGGFYSAQDADSLGVEGLYYLFDYQEIINVLGAEKGKLFNDYYGVTEKGNFNGKNVLNRLNGINLDVDLSEQRTKLYNYRKNRLKLHLDDKILTAWNGLMITALTYLFRVSGEQKYLNTAKDAYNFIETKLIKNQRLYVSIKNEKLGKKGFLDDYVFYCTALISLFSATGESEYLDGAEKVCDITTELYKDENGGYSLNGKENESLICTAKETYDGAIPSGNSTMYFVLTRLNQINGNKRQAQKIEQENFMFREASPFPLDHSVFLLSLLFSETPPPKIVAVCDSTTKAFQLVKELPLYSDICILDKPTDKYKLVKGKTTFYVCKNNTCYPPTNFFKL